MKSRTLEVISLDIALRPMILRAYAHELSQLANELEGDPEVPQPPAQQATAVPTDAPTPELVQAAEPTPEPVEPPKTAQAETPTNPSGVELDADGLPWDSRIHSSSKKQNQDRTWRLKRGLDAGLIEHVKTELRAALAAPEQPAPATTELTPEPTAGSVFGDHTPPPPPAPEPVETAPAGGTPQNYAEFMTRVSCVSADRVNEVLRGLGVPNVALLSTRPDLIPAAWEQLKGEAGA